MFYNLNKVEDSIIKNERLCVSTTEPFVFTRAVTCQRKDGIEFNLMLSVSIPPVKFQPQQKGGGVEAIVVLAPLNNFFEIFLAAECKHLFGGI